MMKYFTTTKNRIFLRQHCNETSSNDPKNCLKRKPLVLIQFSIVSMLGFLFLVGCQNGRLEEKSPCQVLWTQLWEQSKQGSYQARYYLASAVMERVLHLPDQGQGARSLAILTVHSLGYSDGSPFSQERPEMIAEYFRSLRNPSNEEFFSCLEKVKSARCARVGVDKGIIPTFEQFAEDIDAMVKAGHKAECVKSMPRQPSILQHGSP